MFGFGIGEIILIAIVAIIFLGPDKLPEVLVQIVKLFRSFKNTIAETKETLSKEIDLAGLKNDALEYKSKLEGLTKELHDTSNIYNPREVSDLFSDIGKDFTEIEENVKKELTIDTPSTLPSIPAPETATPPTGYMYNV